MIFLSVFNMILARSNMECGNSSPLLTSECIRPQELFIER